MTDTPDLTKARILETARERFFQFGFSKVTTDELAAELGVSKKTLYKYFPAKKDLLQQVVDSALHDIQTGLEHILRDRSLEFHQRMEAIVAYVGEKVARYFNKSFLQDIKKHHPEIWQRVDEFRRAQIYSKFSNLIKEGMRKGVFRKDVDHQVVVLVYLHAVQNIINPETLAQLPHTASQVFDAVVQIIFRGILTDEARKNFFSN